MGFTFFKMKKVILFFGVAFLFFGCGPDLDPTKYCVKSILNSQFEEYVFNYEGIKLTSIGGTDNTSLNYQYFTDSTYIQFQTNEYSDYYTTLVFTAGLLKKVKIRWRLNSNWHKDSVMFEYAGSELSFFKYRNGIYNVSMQNGNLTNIKQGQGALATTMSFSYDSKENPLHKVYWYDVLISPAGGIDPSQLRAIARFFSRNNLTNSDATVLTVKAIYRYSYDYLHDILPKSINLETEISGNKTSNLIFIADIQYVPKNTNTTP